MNLFTCFIAYVAQRRVGLARSRWEDGRARIVVTAADEDDAIRIAREWFGSQLERAEWPVVFGSGTRDAISVRITGITAHEEGAVAVIRIT